MKDRQRAWLLIVLIVLICAATVWGVAFYRSRAVSNPAAMLARLPSRDATVLYIDFDALRKSDVLDIITGPKAAEEPEYKLFVAKTEFNYKQDLDTALVSFHPDGNFFLLRGRFDWKSLRNYAGDQNGTCYNTVCRMAGSTPNRRISFFPLRPDLMALATSSDDSAATRLQERQKDNRAIAIPIAPVWLSVPPAKLKSNDSLPTGTRMFATALSGAQGVMLSLEPDRDNFRTKLEVGCASEQEAIALNAELDKTTTMLRDFIAREKARPNPDDLSGFLTSGVFHREGRNVVGLWTVSRGFLRNLTEGVP